MKILQPCRPKFISCSTDRRFSLICLLLRGSLAPYSLLLHGRAQISTPSMEAMAAVKLNVARAAEQERNIEHRCYLQPPSKEAQKIEDAAAALLNLAQAPVAELNSPRCYRDFLSMGVMCRRKGGELVLMWDAHFRFKGLLEVTASNMASYRARATAAGSSSQEMSQIYTMDVEIVLHQNAQNVEVIDISSDDEATAREAAACEAAAMRRALCEAAAARKRVAHEAAAASNRVAAKRRVAAREARVVAIRGPKIKGRRLTFDECCVFANRVALDGSQVEFLKEVARERPTRHIYVCTIQVAHIDRQRAKMYFARKYNYSFIKKYLDLPTHINVFLARERHCYSESYIWQRKQCRCPDHLQLEEGDEEDQDERG